MRRMDLLPVTRTVMALTVLGTAAIATAASAQAAAGQPAQTSSSGTGDTAGQQETTVEGPQDIQAGQSVAAPTRSSAGTGPSFEFGVEPRYISNYFEAQDEFNSSAPVTPAKSVGIITVSGSLDYNFVQNANSKITGGVRMTISGCEGSHIRLDATPDFVSWTAAGSGDVVDGVATIDVAASQQMLFYRAIVDGP